MAAPKRDKVQRKRKKPWHTFYMYFGILFNIFSSSFRLYKTFSLHFLLFPLKHYFLQKVDTSMLGLNNTLRVNKQRAKTVCILLSLKCVNWWVSEGSCISIIWGMKILGTIPRYTEAGNLSIRSNSLCFSYSSMWFWYMLKLGINCEKEGN